MNRESGIGNRESGIGNRESGEQAEHAFAVKQNLREQVSVSTYLVARAPRLPRRAFPPFPILYSPFTS
ncbi:hypothetical protein C2859_09455 [Xanthomonas citri pv. glycines]|nr:hypothetical protein FPL05_09875 [Xanthomonas citri pv. glycines]QEQ73227.1 hypothetical protein C2859_09455 [Xanthomonas citri pv. glycines]